MRPLSLRPRAVLAVVTALLPGDGRAQAPSIEADVLVVSPREELAITANAATVTVLTAADLERTGERSLPRAIGRAAGVTMVESNLGGGSPVLRGLLGSQVLIVVDGVRLNDSTTRFGPNQSLNTIDPAIVERVEVHLGPASVLYGSDAIGGVIVITTKRRRPGGGGVEGATEVLHDTATRGWRGAFELSGAGERHGWYGVLSGAQWDDLVAGGGREQESTGYHTGAGFGSLEHCLDEARALRFVAWTHRDFDVPRTFSVVPGYGQTTAPFARYDFALQEREQATLTYEDREAFGLAGRLEARLFARSYREQRVRQRTGSADEVSGETDVDTLGLGVDVRKDVGGRHRLTFGVELMEDDVDSTNTSTNLGTGVATPEPGDFAPGARYRTFGVFVQDETRWLEPVLLTLGARWSRYDFEFEDGGVQRGDFDDLTLSAEAAYDASDSLRLGASLAQGFQAPNLEDLANDGDFAGGTELANPALDPARSLTAELSADVLADTWSARAAVFATRIEDTIGRRLVDAGDPNVAGDELYLRDNAGRVDLVGLELGATRALGGLGSPWSLEGGASYVRGRQYDSTVDAGSGEAPLDGVEARRIPPLSGHVAVRWDRVGPAPARLDEAALSLAFALAQDELHPDDVTDPRIDPSGTDAWTVWTLDLGGPLSERVRWRASLVNLLDEEHRVHGSGIDGPGRSAVLSLRASF